MAGLGEITPIKIQLSRENFNALIGRHSQPIRWLSARKCPCIKNTQKVDENCPICKGKGTDYTVETQFTRVETVKATIDGVIELDNVVWVRDFQGNEYTITSQECFAYVDGVKKGQSYQVKYIDDITLSDTVVAEYVSDGLYKVDLSTPVEFGDVQGELLSVSGTGITVNSLFRNYFEIDESLPPETEVTVDITYVNPFQFALIHNNYSKRDARFLTDVDGDGLVIFPQRFEIYIEDILIALNSTSVKKVLIRSTGVIDTLPSFYVYELKSAYSLRAGEKYYFTPYVDFVPYRGNQIKWLQNFPTEGEQVSFTYTYNTAYRVLADVPDPRTSENNRFPRKAVVKLYTDFNTREAF